LATTVPLSFDIYARDHASSTFDRFGRSVSSSNHSVGLLRGGLGRLVGAFAGLGIIYKTTQFLSDSVDQAREANKVGAQTQAVLKSTRGAANLSADAIGNLANKLSLKIGVDDEAIQSGENLLLTFRNVRNEVGKGNDIFTRATKIAQDLSVSLGQDLKSSNIQLGKALNDPLKGLTALSRVGVSFNAHQTKMIQDAVAQNRTLDAQKIILRELNKEFRGSAKAQADPADRAKVAWENFQETVGLKVLPVLDKLLIWFVGKGLPAIQQFGGWLSEKLSPVISAIADGFSGTQAKGDSLSSAVTRYYAAFRQLYDAMSPIAVDIAQSVKRNWPEIKATIISVLNAVSGVIRSFSQLVTVIWAKFGDTIKSYTGNTFRNIAQVIRGGLKVIQGIIDVFTGILTGDWSKAWKGVKEIFSGAIQVIVALVRQMINNVKTTLSALKAALGSAVSSAWESAKNATTKGIARVVGFVRSLPGKIKNAVGDLGQLLFDAGVQVIQGLIDGITSKIDELKSLAGNVGGGIKEGFKSALGIHSPSKVMAELGVDTMQGLIDGITSKIQTLRSTIQSVAEMVSGLFGNPLSGENVNTVADIFRQQRSETSSATRLRNDIKRLLHKGLDMRFITDLISTGNLGALHELAMAPAAQVRRFERGQERLERVERRTSGILNRHDRERLQDLKREREKDRKAYKEAVKEGAREGVREGMRGGSSHHKARGGV
jgi:hypothetical protein